MITVLHDAVLCHRALLWKGKHSFMLVEKWHVLLIAFQTYLFWFNPFDSASTGEKLDLLSQSVIKNMLG